MIVALDSSCIIAALCEWHEAHDAVQGLMSKLWGKGVAIVPAHALVESYAVLTRLPPPHRVEAEIAAKALMTFQKNVTLVSLPAQAYWRFVVRVANQRIAGGITYDALILEIGRHAKAEQLWTLNIAHFSRLAAQPIELVNPALDAPF